jgi:hypothetical protein
VAEVHACFKQLAHGKLWKSHGSYPFRFSPRRKV